MDPAMCLWGIPVYPDSRLPEGVIVITSDTTPHAGGNSVC